MHDAKGYVRNKAHPEASIAEGYLSEECMTFCSWYLHDMKTRMNRHEHDFDGGYVASCKKISIFITNGRSLGASDWEVLDAEEWSQAKDYVLQNCEEVLPWIE